MDPAWKSILTDKRMLAGLGVAAMVGFVVFVRRSGSASADTATTTPASATTSGGYYTGADTSGTDIASFLSTWGNQMLTAVQQGNQVAPTDTSSNTSTTPTTPAATAKSGWTLPTSMTIKQVAQQLYGSSSWNGPAGRLYYANEGTVVGAARNAGVNSNYADYKLPAGFVINNLL